MYAIRLLVFKTSVSMQCFQIYLCVLLLSCNICLTPGVKSFKLWPPPTAKPWCWDWWTRRWVNQYLIQDWHLIPTLDLLKVEYKLNRSFYFPNVQFAFFFFFTTLLRHIWKKYLLFVFLRLTDACKKQTCVQTPPHCSSCFTTCCMICHYMSIILIFQPQRTENSQRRRQCFPVLWSWTTNSY